MPKNKQAAALARLRWKGSTKAQRSQEMAKVAGAISKDAASARARKAWATKKRKAKKGAS